ncbi:MAG TPA: hypothetical protein VHF22_09580, partial [Planctomycetota bacterium]|nr:hypothetical protein [Planctomycetota bacterium]
MKARASKSQPPADYLDILTGAANGLDRIDLDELRARVRGEGRSLDRDAVRERLAKIEARVAKDPASAFEFDSAGNATLVTSDRRYEAGRFETVPIGRLRDRAAAVAERGGSGGKGSAIRLSIALGGDPLLDIGALQGWATERTLFQVASQFNCLESVGPFLSPVRNYPSDPTQGPRASVSAFPGIFLRHYAAPSPDGRFEQRSERQLDLLARAIPRSVGRVESGYLSSQTIGDKKALAPTLLKNFESIEVGVHDGIEVVFGHNWGGPVSDPAPRIAQVLTSTLALGCYSDNGKSVVGACKPLLRAAYLGTILAAFALGKRRAVLTLIGGGAFGNPLDEIWAAIRWAIGEADGMAHGPLDVVVNARESSPPEEIREEVKRRKGTVVSVDEREKKSPKSRSDAKTSPKPRSARAGEPDQAAASERPGSPLNQRSLLQIQELFHGL